MLKPPICISPRENSMSIENMAPDLVCSIQCNFCNTILAVNVPSSTVCPAILTVRCGHCANLLPINIAASLQPLLHQDQIHQLHKPYIGSEEGIMAIGSSSKGKNFSSFESNEQKQPRMLPPIHPPEKKQRVPSAYNRFIKEEIQRIKASNPDISHREAFSTAAKNWAHFPHIHFGLQLDNGNTQTKLDHHHHHHHHSFRSAASTHKSHAGFY